MRCAVIGDPADHSLSPAIHRAGYRLYDLDWEYEAISITAERMPSFVESILADPRWAGLSVTAPHKEAILAYGEPDSVSKLVGAGNTLLAGESPTVHNTDVPGFVRAWRHHDLKPPKVAVVVGNGATARSILVALTGLETSRVIVLARNPERAQPLSELGNALGITVEVQPIDQPLVPVDLVASTIPAAATAPYAKQWASAAKVLFDAIYDPWPTPLSQAAAAGQPTLSGLDLLAGQAVDQFLLLTGRKVTFEQCHSAAAEELRSRS